MIKSLTILKEEIVTSLKIEPATFGNLCNREFLKNYSNEGIERLIFQLEKDKKIYYRGKLIFAYKNS